MIYNYISIKTKFNQKTRLRFCSKIQIKAFHYAFCFQVDNGLKKNDVVWKLLRRQNVKSTLLKRLSDVVCWTWKRWLCLQIPVFLIKKNFYQQITLKKTKVLIKNAWHIFQMLPAVNILIFRNEKTLNLNAFQLAHDIRTTLLWCLFVFWCRYNVHTTSFKRHVCLLG